MDDATTETEQGVPPAEADAAPETELVEEPPAPDQIAPEPEPAPEEAPIEQVVEVTVNVDSDELFAIAHARIVELEGQVASLAAELAQRDAAGERDSQGNYRTPELQAYEDQTFAAEVAGWERDTGLDYEETVAAQDAELAAAHNEQGEA